MRVVVPENVEKGRVLRGPYGSDASFGNNGAFVLRSPRATKLYVLVSDGAETGWEHVSISVLDKNRCPYWDEMCFVKEAFWGEEEVVVQIHPKKSAYVNNHPYVLHLWKRRDVEAELPPQILVGIQSAGNLLENGG